MRKLNVLSSMLAATIPMLSHPRFGEGEGDAAKIDFTNPEVIAAINAAAQSVIEKETLGLKTKNEELLGKMKELQVKSKDFEGLDPLKIKAMMAALDQSEEAKLMAEGKLDEVIQKRLDRVTSQHSEAVKTLQTQLEEANTNATTYKSKLDRNQIQNVIGKAALELGVLPEAIDDIVRRAGDIFSVDKDGKVQALDKDGFLVKQENLELTPSRFIEGLKKSAPYYWPASAGAGAKGGQHVIDGKTDKGVAAAAEIVGGGNGFDLAAYRKARGTDVQKR